MPPGSDTRRCRRLIIVVGLALAGTHGIAPAQVADESSFVFDDSSIPVIRIQLSESDYDLLFAPGNQYSDDELLALFEFERGGTVFRQDSVGFRLRGNTSRDAAKKSFKVSFNSFRVGGEFFDLEKLNLNGEHNDPSIMRAKLSWDLFNALGLPASRANHVTLYINGKYYGVYLNVEHVDEKFLARNFGNNDGNLYKCLYPADLRFLGTDPDAYRPTGDSRGPYDLKLKDDDLLGYDDLARFITTLNTTTDAQFLAEIEKVFDVNGFLRAHALTVLLGSWDSYWFLKNNFYLYFNTDTGKFEYIPFDFDNVTGIWWDGIYPGLDWSARNVYAWGHPDEERPLVTRILANPQLRERYSFYLERLLSETFDRGLIEPGVLAMRDSIALFAAADSFRTLDYGFTMQDFEDSYFGPLSNQAHVVDGIFSFIETRARTALSQLERSDVMPIISDLHVSPRRARPSGSVTFAVRVEDEQVDRVELHYWLGSPTENIAIMTASPELGPDMYVATITAQDRRGFIDYRVEAVDAGGQRSATKHETLSVGEAVPLYINEFMAANETTVRDPANEFDDWIELYNGGDTEISLAGFFMTDTLGLPFKWALPDTTIPSRGHLLVWADEDGMQGALHANFKLSRFGEVVAIFDNQGALIDSVSFDVQAADVSYGRLPDGGPSFVSFSSPTPGVTNGGAVGVQPQPASAILSVVAYPNPSRGPLFVSFSTALDDILLEVFDVLGRRVALVRPEARWTQSVLWDGRSQAGGSLPAGVYVLRASGVQSNSENVVRSVPLVRLN